MCCDTELCQPTKQPTHIHHQQHRRWLWTQLIWAGSGQPSSFGPGRVKGAQWEDCQLWRLLSLSKTTVHGPERPNWARAGVHSIVPIDEALPGGSGARRRRRQEKRRGREDGKRRGKKKAAQRDVRRDKRGKMETGTGGKRETNKRTR